MQRLTRCSKGVAYLCYLICLFNFFCLYFTLSFPCHALPSVVLHSFLPFPHLSPLLNIHWITVQITGSLLNMASPHLAVSFITCLHLSAAFSSACSSLSSSQKRKKCTMTSVLTITQPFHCGNLAGPGLRHT